jgi:O-methyltransferase
MADQISLSSELLDYIRDVSLREDEVLRELRDLTMDLPGGPSMLVMPEEGQLLSFLVSLTGARTIVEIGTFTGYSTLCMAKELPPQGRLITCDITKKWPAIGSDYWRRSGVDDRIEVRIGPAVETLAILIEELGENAVDLIFIDADKSAYVRYYELSLRLLRPGGVIIIDNTLFFGRVSDHTVQDPETNAMRELNATLHRDDRVSISLLPMADGITLVRKKLAGPHLRLGRDAPMKGT